MRHPRLVGVLAASCCALAGCGPTPATAPVSPAVETAVFRAAECNGVADADVTEAVGSRLFTRSW